MHHVTYQLIVIHGKHLNDIIHICARIGLFFFCILYVTILKILGGINYGEICNSKTSYTQIAGTLGQYTLATIKGRNHPNAIESSINANIQFALSSTDRKYVSLIEFSFFDDVLYLVPSLWRSI